MSSTRSTIHLIKHEATLAAYLAQQMRELFDADDELVSNTIEGETQLNELIARAVMRTIELDEAQDGIKNMVAKLRERSQRFDKQKNGLRDALLYAMTISGVKKLALPVATVSVGNAPRRLTVTDAAAIPAEFWKQPPPELMKRELAEALKDHPVPGAALDNGGEQLLIRTS